MREQRSRRNLEELMKRMTMVVGFILGALFLFAQPAAAQGDLYLFGGVQHPGRITLDNALSTGGSGGAQIISDPTDVGVFGARFSHGGLWGGEYTIGFAPNFLDSNSKALIYNSDVRILLPLPAVQPYFVAGGGAITTWGSGASNIGTKFALNYGGGIRLIPAGPVGVQIDVRGYTVPALQSQTLNVAEVSMGLVFRLGDR
jgi:hypothetical protein